MSVRDIIHAAADEGVDLGTLRHYKRRTEAQEWARREIPWAVRRAAWRIHQGSNPEAWCLWPFGFQRSAAKYGCLEGDYTNFPGYDEIHDGIKRQFPQYDTPDGEERLFEYLFGPANPMPSPTELYEMALDDALSDRDRLLRAVDVEYEVTDFLRLAPDRE